MRLGTANPKSLLLGTALASTLIFSIVLAPAPVAAQAVPCPGTPPSGSAPIVESSTTNPIVCNNPDNRYNDPVVSGVVIDLDTSGGDYDITLTNSGRLTATSVDTYAFGIRAVTSGTGSRIQIGNTGVINANTSGAPFVDEAIGILAVTSASESDIVIVNGASIGAQAITASGAASAYGIQALAFQSNVSITNLASVTATNADAYGAGAYGIDVIADLNVGIDNRGTITAQAISGAATTAVGIGAESFTGIVTITNRAEILAIAGQQFGYAAGISAYAGGAVTIENHGDIVATAAFATGIYACATAPTSPRARSASTP